MIEQQIEKLRTLQESFNELSSKVLDTQAVLTELNNGKKEMVDALATKNVQSSIDKTLSSIASDIRSIAQSPITIEGGEMYEKQLFGAPTDKTNAYEQPDSPMWNLYQVMANLLSDGRFVTYGGILLAEYTKEDNTTFLQGAGAGGAYLTSDGALYETGTTHTWNDTLDGKVNRWVAYIFKNENAEYTINSVALCPITIHIGRKVGKITDSVAGKITEIVVTDGNYLDSVNLIAQSWNPKANINNLRTFSGTLFAGSTARYVSAGIKKLTGGRIWSYVSNNIESISLPELEEITGGYVFDTRNQRGNIGVKRISMPKLTTISTENRIFDAYNSENLPNLKEWYMPNLKRCKTSAYNQGLVFGPKVTKVTVGEMDSSFVIGWNIAINTNPEVELINKNIRLYIADRISDRTGLSSLTISFHNSMYAILEQETKDAFIAKNWSVASY